MCCSHVLAFVHKCSNSGIQSKNIYIRGDIKLVCHIAKIKIEANEFETT